MGGCVIVTGWMGQRVGGVAVGREGVGCILLSAAGTTELPRAAMARCISHSMSVRAGLCG